LKNPTRERLLHCIRAGEVATFHKLEHIRNNIAIEHTLAACERRAKLVIFRFVVCTSGGK
jgi:hypothetical protein